MTKKQAIEGIQKGLWYHKVGALLKRRRRFSYCLSLECVEYQQRYNPEDIVKVFYYERELGPQTHFIAAYSVRAKDMKTGQIRQHYYATEPRENKFLKPFTKSAGDEMVAVFKISYRK